MIVLENIDNKDFQIAMGQGMKKATRHFKSLVTPDISGYVLSDQWKAIDFKFVHHEGRRINATEEQI